MKRTKALVIDDEQIVLDSVNRILSHENFQVHMAQNSRTGLDLGTNSDYDVLLTDIRMPDRDQRDEDPVGSEESEATAAGGHHHGLCDRGVRSEGD